MSLLRTSTVVSLVSLAVLACGGSSAPQVGNPSGTPSGTTDGDSGTPASTGPSPTGNGPGAAADGGTSSNPNPTGSDSGSVVVTPGDGGPSACRAKGSEVVMIGDSYPALSGEITTHLEHLATSAGALASGDSYRTYYVSGTNMVGGTSPNIPAQFAEAVAANADVKYVIMDGGGNDILLDNTACITTQPPPASQTCVDVINAAVSAATTLFGQMKAAGVQKVVYYFYPHLPTNGKPYVNTTLDYAYPLVQAACTSAAIPCSFVDTRTAFEGHPEYIGQDGIHPTTAGSDILAGLIWGVMQKQCVAQ